MKMYSKRIMSAALLFLMLLSGCLSYSIKGLAGYNAPPDKSIIGMSYKDVVERYGIPDRVFYLNQNVDMGKNPPPMMKNNMEFMNLDFGKIAKEGDFMVNYQLNKKYIIILYSRERSYNYFMTIKDDKVAAVNSGMSNKKDGIGFSLGDIFSAGNLMGDDLGGGMGK